MKKIFNIVTQSGSSVLSIEINDQHVWIVIVNIKDQVLWGIRPYCIDNRILPCTGETFVT